MLKYTSLLSQLFIKYQYQIWLILFLIICIGIVTLLFRVKLTPSVKINNFFFTYILVGIYISFYFLLFFVLRIYQLGKELDLKLFYDKLFILMDKYIEASIFAKILMLLTLVILLLIWLLIFIRIRKLLEFKLWQIYFYYKNRWRIITPKAFSKAWSPYLMWKYDKYFSFRRFSLKIYEFILNITNDFFMPSRQLFFKFQTIISFIFLISFLLFILVECFISDFILFYSFYFLIFYMLIIIWMRIGLAIDNDYPYLEEILIERAYGEPDVLYVNLTKEEEFLLELYITNTPKAIEIDLEMDVIPWEIVELHPITYRCRFERITLEKLERIVGENLDYSPDAVIYFNKYRGLYFFKKDLEIKNGKYFVREEIQNA